ncbi:TetR family transcriptional regulator [Streptomyces sp. SID8379]|uniref:TetR/AcrR family transcriptional regulator n=2 Tax=unclassified Streptomyces TaxID=2593676 RepID=UPI00047630C5|nr:TetR/AcrR family transcriptional regulator [Streptomyces sp. HmicA12]MYW69683.1 TetR family transcriptional regulator [Streptomyces sp. SID8379]
MTGMPHPTSLRRTPVQQRSTERLSRILDACAALLDEGGYERLSTRAVAGRAEVPIGSVYRFFTDKRAMVDALAQRNLERYAERVTERLGDVPADDWRAAIDAILDEYLAMKRTAPGFSLVDFGTQIPVGDPDSAPNLRVADTLTDLLAPHLGVTADAGLRRTFLVAVESADALVRLAFRLDPAGDEKIITETRELLRAYLARVLD